MLNYGHSQDFSRGGSLFENFEKIRKKIAKIHYFSIFLKSLANHALNFCEFRRKTQLLEILRKFSKNLA